MLSARPVFAVVALILLAAGMWWLAGPHLPPSARLVEPRLRSLQEPFTAIAVFHYQDGGSIGIDIVDAHGRREQFAIPSTMGSNERHKRVYVGALHGREPNAVEVEHSAATKQALIRLLARNRDGDPYLDSALAVLGGRPLNYARCIVHRYRQRYNTQ